MRSILVPPLRPTLWRTCRVLANEVRLRLFREVAVHPGQGVSSIASTLGLSVALASKYLRELNARGLVAARRVAGEVRYRCVADASIPGAGRLLRALERTYAAETQPAEVVFRLATAFTHPRRVLIVRALEGCALTKAQIRSQTGISEMALNRHLRKLESRGFVARDGGKWRCVRSKHPLAAALTELACHE